MRIATALLTIGLGGGLAQNTLAGPTEYIPLGMGGPGMGGRGPMGQGGRMGR